MTTAVDASAILAILLDEPEKHAFIERILADKCEISPIGYWEAGVRVRRLHGEEGMKRLDRLISELDILISPALAETARLATDAEREYGKHTPAKLNLGDCFAYALAKERNLPLLYKGCDFIHTDIEPALKA